MKTFEFEIHYNKADLTSGTCKCCGEYSKEIVKSTGKCTDCLEEERFFNETIKNENNGFTF